MSSLTTSLVNFRLDLLRELAARADVLALGPEREPEAEARLAGIGVHFATVPMERTGMNPSSDLGTLASLVRTFRAFRPDIVLPYTMKPMIYGGLAARITRVPSRYSLCTGLGYAFSGDHPSPRQRIVRSIAVQLYRAAHAGLEEAFVYNSADEADFRRFRLVSPATPVTRVPGSGVNIDRFQRVPVPDGPPVFLLIARLLGDKGIREYVAAARQIRREHPEARCLLLGPTDCNPTAIHREELEGWQAEGSIEYLGETCDVRPYLAQCTVFVLPSTYREGLPRTVLEAMATGRAVITSDIAGCSDAVEHGVTGLIVKPRDPVVLAAAMRSFLRDPTLTTRMGAAGRARAERLFDVDIINALLVKRLRLDTPHSDEVTT